MKRVPQLYLPGPGRTWDLNPLCAWVRDGEGIASRMYDGVCVMHDGSTWWVRHHVTRDADAPDLYREVDYDTATGVSTGWAPISASPHIAAHARALSGAGAARVFSQGTYELCGPGIKGNAEKFTTPTLLWHPAAEVDAKLSFPAGLLDADQVIARVRELGAAGWEGVVWQGRTGQMAKMKARPLLLD